jgi:radical SAM superfamily enzyme YgiQ (UPF0313 family)
MAQSCRDLYLPYGKVLELDTSDGYPILWDLYDYKKFRYFPSLKAGPVLPVITAYGCKYKCSYCPYASYYGDWAPRDLDCVLKELDDDVTKYGAKGIIFRDPLFTANRDRTLKILEALRGYTNLSFACETRIERVDAELLDIMAASGCKAIHFGIESGSEEVLRSVCRVKPSNDKIKWIIDYCEKIGIKTTCFFILGFPADTEETIEDTIRLSININSNIAEFFISTPYPGTKLSKEVEMVSRYEDMTGYKLCFKHNNFTSERLAEIRNSAYKRFYMRFGWIKKFIKMI